MNFVNVRPDSLNSRSVLLSQGVMGGQSLRKTRKIIFLVSFWLVSATSNSMFGNSPRLLSEFFLSLIRLRGEVQVLRSLASTSFGSLLVDRALGNETQRIHRMQTVHACVDRIEYFCLTQRVECLGVRELSL